MSSTLAASSADRPLVDSKDSPMSLLNAKDLLAMAPPMKATGARKMIPRMRATIFMMRGAHYKACAALQLRGSERRQLAQTDPKRSNTKNFMGAAAHAGTF